MVDDEQDVGARGLGAALGPERAARLDGRAHEVVELVGGGGDHPRGAEGVLGLLRAHVGEPLEPVPVGDGVLVGQDRDAQVGGGHHHGQVRDHRPELGVGEVPGAAQLQGEEPVEVDAEWRGPQVRLDIDEARQGRLADDVGLGQGAQFGGFEPFGEFLLGDPEADVEDPGPAGAPLPHAGPAGGQEDQ